LKSLYGSAQYNIPSSTTSVWGYQKGQAPEHLSVQRDRRYRHSHFSSTAIIFCTVHCTDILLP
jgi:hypothetical protein